MDKKQLVTIKWEDITFYNGHYDLKKRKIETFEIQTFETTGYLLEKTKDYILIALTFGSGMNDDRIADVYKFPMGCVKEIKNETRKK